MKLLLLKSLSIAFLFLLGIFPTATLNATSGFASVAEYSSVDVLGTGQVPKKTPKAKKQKHKKIKGGKKAKEANLGRIFGLMFFIALGVTILVSILGLILGALSLGVGGGLIVGILGAISTLASIAYFVGGIGALVTMGEGDPLAKAAGITFIVLTALAIILLILLIVLVVAGILML